MYCISWNPESFGLKAKVNVCGRSWHCERAVVGRDVALWLAAEKGHHWSELNGMQSGYVHD